VAETVLREHDPAQHPAGPCGATPPGDRAAARAPAPAAGWARGFLLLPEVRWAALATLLLGVAIAGRGLGAPEWLTGILYAGCYVSGGWEPGLAGLQALRAGTLDVDLLMVVAAAGAAAIGQVFDGGLLIVIFSTSGALEAVATKRTGDSVRGLLSLAPERATRLGPGGSEDLVDTATLVPGDRILVRPGERIGADGFVGEGASEVDQASITGESMPVFRGPGDEVFAGTLNGEGALVVRVTRLAAESVVARIVALVEEASATKAQLQLFIEKVEQRYSIGVVVSTLALFFVPLALGGALQPTLLRAMTFMIVASPCAVVLATMPPLLGAIATAGRHGVLVKSAVVMEQLASTTQVVFDKTGTLTEGMPQLTAVLAVPGSGWDGDTILALAASAEHGSQHPLGRAVVAAAHDRGLTLSPADGFRSTPGRGVQALVDGRRVEVGSPALLGAAARAAAPVGCLAANEEEAGRTAAVVLVDGVPVGVLGLADRMRPNAREVVASLSDLTGRRPIMLTGDNAGAAGLLAEAVGIADVRAGLLPGGKVEAVRGLQAAGERVLLVGDGVNDAPALAAAHLGVAMGRAGSDLALETADAVVVHDELATLPNVVDLSRKAHRVVVQNLWFAGCVIAALVLIDLVARLPLPLGVAGHEGSTVVVGLNGLRLLRERAWRTTGPGSVRRIGVRRIVRSSGGRKGGVKRHGHG
jgi:heavy metal translocating P-type ATPase